MITGELQTAIDLTRPTSNSVPQTPPVPLRSNLDKVCTYSSDSNRSSSEGNFDRNTHLWIGFIQSNVAISSGRQ